MYLVGAAVPDGGGLDEDVSVQLRVPPQGVVERVAGLFPHKEVLMW